MSVSPVKGDYCSIEGFEPTSKTTDAVNQMNKVVDMSSLLENVLMAAPSFSIFAGRDTYLSANMGAISYNLVGYNWKLFSEAVVGVSAIRRAKLEQIAASTADISMGKEREFWICVYNSL
ncbi:MULTISPECIES: hypothetical protein [unclassified Salinivibrio]|jgi:hypothetical protein|uniref:hypothetical protein n=1 Tax=unclassified Salinivibrio TaxID=2636825 RepID=UPI00084CDCD8|nr:MULTISPECIES: hypothetical protein [unclassified Salinivibrio]ODQ00893.1 hypothetical protein BGK46_04405 [Salinivibrio sp. DV]OOF22207.1 hypothetical protein BZJ18_15285 [Salinivibrio sp. IB872]